MKIQRLTTIFLLFFIYRQKCICNIIYDWMDEIDEDLNDRSDCAFIATDWRLHEPFSKWLKELILRSIRPTNVLKNLDWKLFSEKSLQINKKLRESIEIDKFEIWSSKGFQRISDDKLFDLYDSHIELVRKKRKL